VPGHAFEAEWRKVAMEISSAVVPLALAAAASPLPLLGVLLLLLTPRAVANGLAFTSGWSAALLVVGAGVLAVFGSDSALSRSGVYVAPVEALLGVVLVLLAGWHWRRRPRSGSAVRVPGWLAAADDCTPARAFAVGIVMVVLNPKVLTLVVVAATTIGAGSADVAIRGMALLLFAGLGSVGVGIPLALRVALGMRATRRLSHWRNWLVSNGAAVTTTVLAALGLLLLIRAAAAI